MTTVDSLLRACEQHLDIAFQPIVNSQTGCLYGYEALTRHTDRLGFASPLQLLDAAAALGALWDLNQILLRRTIEKYSKLKSGNEILYLNVDARIFEGQDGSEGQEDFEDQADYVSTVSNELQLYNLTLADVCFELSETRPILRKDIFSARRKSWSDKGALLALDDFGQGYSGLRALYEISPDFIKIDRFFIADLELDRKKRVLVQAITDLAHGLGIKVIAEGMEKSEEADICKQIGCDFLQGYFISYPKLDIDDLNHSIYPAIHV